MRKLIWNIKIDEYDYGIIINALNELRNKLIRQERDTTPVDEIFVKLIDTPPKNQKRERQYETR